MAKMFPNHPNLIGGYAPIQMECDAPDLIVQGEVPRELATAYLDHRVPFGFHGNWKGAA
jgi:carotenoid cleavage dioxygenase-like enzyme